MAFKAIVFLCAQALLAQVAFSQCLGRAGLAGGYGWAGRGLGYGGRGTGCGCGGIGITATSGGGLPVASASAIPPVGVSVASDNVYEGILCAAGELPFVGTVGVEGVLPTAGAGAVNYGCGNGATAMVSDIAPGIGGAYGGYGAYGAGLGGYGGRGYGGWAGRGSGCGCGCGPLCGGHCCGRGRESQLRSSLQHVTEVRVAGSTKWAADLLLATRRTLQDHLTSLSHQSQNKTAMLFTQIYRGYATRTVQPVSTLYDDIRTVLRSSDPGKDLAIDIFGTNPPRDLAVSAKKFFRDIFPVAYHNALKLDLKQFTPEYEACLKDAFDAVQPFGDVPQQMGTSLSRSLEAARALLQMLAVGADALTTTGKILASAGDLCSEKLLRAGGCARCQGHDARPCKNYCLNVARGCLGSVVSQLDGPWAGYVEGVEGLAKLDADLALWELETKVSKAIMYALENKAIAENKVRQECGLPSTVESTSKPTPYPAPGSIRRESLRAPPPDTELLQFAATLASTKNLFADISDRLCDEPDFSVEEHERCWNGNAIGEYTKPLVSSASVSDQKYNSEISGSPPQDSRTAALADRLQQARQLLMSYRRGNDLQTEVFMQSDEAGDEGSGSGRSYPDDYDSEGSGDEGSGSHDGQTRTFINEVTPDSSTPRTSAAHTPRPLLSSALLVVITALRRCAT